MKKNYIKPEIIFVDLITEGEFCCSPGCLGCDDCEDEDETVIDPAKPKTENNIYAYRQPIWDD